MKCTNKPTFVKDFYFGQCFSLIIFYLAGNAKIKVVSLEKSVINMGF